MRDRDPLAAHFTAPARNLADACTQALLFGIALLLPGLAGISQAEAQDRALALSDSGYVDFGDHGDVFDMVPGGQRTYTLWLRYFQPHFQAQIFSKRGPLVHWPHAGFNIYMRQYHGTLAAEIDPAQRIGEPEYRVVGASGIKVLGDGNWHHVAIVQDDSVLYGYADGQLDFALNIARQVDSLATDRPLWLGWTEREAIFFVGEVDEISIWHRAFNAREVAAIMYSPPSGAEDGLVAYWPLDVEDGSTVRDIGPNGYHGTLHGGARYVASTRPTAPPFTETVWFYLLIALAGLAILYLLMRLYALRIERQRRRLETIVAERTEEVARQAQQLAQQAKELKMLDRAKSRFFANISHEFRTPLTLSQAPIEDILSGRCGEISSEARDGLNVALLADRRLLRLVDRLLDLARLEADTLTLHVRPVDLTTYVRSLAQAFEALAESRGITFTQGFPGNGATAYLDEERFEEVLGNVLSNAMKFTPAGGRVHLELRTEPDLAIEVRDNGPGIPPDKLAHIFDRFFRADDTGTKPGSGIGLSLAKELAERHGGRIEVDSLEGFGSTFTIHLRRGKEHFDGRDDVAIESGKLESVSIEAAVPEPHVEPLPDDPEDDRTTVLIVDDNAEIRDYVARHLMREYRVLTAEDGETALEMIRGAVPDLVLSDVMMPRLDGLDLLRELRRSPETDFVPVILLTARAGVEARVDGISAGADEYLEKPFSVKELQASVRNLILQRKRLRLRYSGNREPAVAPPEMASTDGVFLERLRSIVGERLEDEDFDVDALAGALAVDRSHLYRRMIELTGQAPSVFVKLARLERAAALLSARAGSISEVAYASGFRSVSHFSRSFAEQFGRSPSAYAAEQPS